MHFLEIWRTCAEQEDGYKDYRVLGQQDLERGDYVIDPDGPLPVKPFTVECKDDITLVEPKSKTS